MPLDPPPRRDTKDHLQSIVEAATAAIPLAGGTTSRLIAAVIKPSYDRRLEAWLARVAETIDELENKQDGWTLDDLIGNEEFLTVHGANARCAGHSP